MTVLVSVIVFFTTRQLFEKEDVYFVSYEGLSVSGLEVGSPVKYMGINVGTITDIKIDPQDVNTIVVQLSLKPGTPIKENATADIISMGITGLKSIEISGGSNEAESLKPGAYIQPGISFSGEITGKAEIIAQKAEQVLNNLLVFTQPQNLNKITELAEQAAIAIINFDSIITENRMDIRQTILPLKDISMRLDTTSRLMLSTVETLQFRMNSDTINEIFANFRDLSVKLNETNIKSLIDDIAVIARQTEQLLSKVDSDLDKGSHDFSRSLHLLRLSLENLNEASMKINNNPSVLLKGSNIKNSPDRKLEE